MIVKLSGSLSGVVSGQATGSRTWRLVKGVPFCLPAGSFLPTIHFYEEYMLVLGGLGSCLSAKGTTKRW
jgi:hypothetical protein